MSYANGRCIVTKKEGPCLVIPQGSFSPSRQTYLSKEGADKLVEVMKDGEKAPGVCCINRKEYDECVVIPRGVINPKIQYLMSAEAIQGMASAAANITLEEKAPKPVVEPVVEETKTEDPVLVPPEEEKKTPKKKKASIPKKKKEETYADPSSGKTIEVDE